MKQFGRYEVVEEIGAGAMGAVFKARDPVMDRIVAVKTIHASALVGPMAEQYRERFTREARAAGRLAHPGIVTMFDAGVEGDTPYLVMEYVPGHTLEDVLNTGEHYPLDKVCEIGQQLAEALAYAHLNGVIHRDIKPANIQLTGSPERAKIMDFGVAKLTQAQVTSTGTLLGTPSYMAPEQFTGMPLDGRSDLFSLGVILYWMATGDKPFSGDTITAVSYKIVHTEPIAPRQLNPGVPEGLEAVILKCLAKDPAARHQTGEELAADLAALRAGQTAAAASGIRAAAPAADPGSTISSAATVPLGSSAQMRRSGMQIPAQPPAPSATPAATQRATAAPAPRPLAPEIPRRVVPAPPPQRSSAKIWIYTLAAVLVVAILWGAGVAKRNRERQAAEQAARQQPMAAAPEQAVAQPQSVPPPPPATANPSVTGGAPSRAATVPASPAPEESKRAPAIRSPAPAKMERPAPTVPATQADVSGFPLRLEVSASAPANVEITADDNPARMQSLRGGDTLKAGANKILQVRTDNAGALHLKLNDHDMPELGPMGSPRTVRYTARSLSSLPAPTTGQEAGETPATRAGAAKKAQVDVEVTNLPRFADFAIMVDGQVLFERKGMLEGGADSLSRVESIAPGTHTIVVFIGNRKAMKGVRHEVSGDFSAGQTRTLHVGSHFEGRRAPGMFQFDLSLD
jgi:eukaryotic-like serine/threonine-protein kinase